jgi:hypothetical protein
MKYSSGETIELGDIVSVPVPSGSEKAKVIFLGETYEHGLLEESFTEWVKESKHLRSDSIYVEWVNNNPLEHKNEDYAPVGNRMQTVVDKHVKFIERKNDEKNI